MIRTLPVLEALMGLSGYERIKRLARGLPARTFPALASLLDVHQEHLAIVLGLNPRTLRSRTSNLSAEESEKAFRVYRVFAKAKEIFGSDEQARLWLNSPSLALGDQKPLDLLNYDIGADEVINVLGCIQEGVYL